MIIEDGEHWQRGIGSWEVFIVHKVSSLSKRLPQVLKIKRGCDKNDKSDWNSIKMTNPVRIPDTNPKCRLINQIQKSEK